MLDLTRHDSSIYRDLVGTLAMDGQPLRHGALQPGEGIVVAPAFVDALCRTSRRQFHVAKGAMPHTRVVFATKKSHVVALTQVRGGIKGRNGGVAHVVAS